MHLAGGELPDFLPIALEFAGEDLDAAAAEPEQPLDVLWEEPVAFDGCPTSARPRDGVQPIHFHHQGASS
ncbi:MAG: hypothetical protein K0B16_15655 [Burkholderiaceae bacterium]|nr:hypothetical protein [Burkholderiaceae bacterium]